MRALKRVKSRWDVWSLEARMALLRGRRLVSWLVDSRNFPPPVLAPGHEAFPHTWASERVPLARHDGFAHAFFEEGKRHNVALAASAFDGLLLSPAQPFSFWRTLGPATQDRGFRMGMELSGGCVVPSMGGGLCLVSNALFRLAVRCGFDIVERHGHTIDVGSTNEVWGLDATVLFPYVDLRFKPRFGRCRLDVTCGDDAVELRLSGQEPLGLKVALESTDEARQAEQGVVMTRNTVRRRIDFVDGQVAHDVVATNRKQVWRPEDQQRSCLTCGEVSCARRPDWVDQLSVDQ